MVSNLGATVRTVTPPGTMTVLYTAAHSGFDLARVPLGGAATICALLNRAWEKQPPFKLHLLSPDLLGDGAPRGKDLVRYSELRYARFCGAFEKAITSEIVKHNPRDVVVLSNDISEGPDFRRLSEQGYRVYTIYHVDVVDYFSKMYLGGLARPETLTAFHRFLERSPVRHLIPALLKLIFQKQNDSVRYSQGLIVPSEGMKRVLMACYPGVDPKRIHVLPWGCPEEPVEEAAVARRAEELRKVYAIPEGAPVLLTLSRISPEKGQDLLLRALRCWERRGELPREGLWVFICGEAAYMQGARFKKRLDRLAAQLRKVHVIFPGHVAGLEKQAYYRLAHLYVFPSRHESYGLTLLEAFRAGLPAVACPHYGAEETLRPEFGELLPPAKENAVPAQLQTALECLLSDPARLKRMGLQAQAFARQRPFSATASRLAGILKGEG